MESKWSEVLRGDLQVESNVTLHMHPSPPKIMNIRSYNSQSHETSCHLCSDKLQDKFLRFHSQVWLHWNAVLVDNLVYCLWWILLSNLNLLNYKIRHPINSQTLWHRFYCTFTSSIWTIPTDDVHLTLRERYVQHPSIHVFKNH